MCVCIHASIYLELNHVMCPSLAPNLQSTCLDLPSSSDYKCIAPCPAQIFLLCSHIVSIIIKFSHYHHSPSSWIPPMSLSIVVWKWPSTMPACSLCTLAMPLNHLDGENSTPYLNTKALQSHSEHFILKRTLKAQVHLKHSDKLSQRSGIPGRKKKCI